MKNLKLQLAFLLPALCIGLSSRATTRTVNNTTIPVSPGQYNTITAAISVASSGDTVIVAGSATPYDFATITLNKPLVLIGAGYNPQGANTNPTTIDQVFQFSCGASGSTIMGFTFNNEVVSTTGGGTTYNNITFARNYFNYTANTGLYFNNSDSCNNIYIVNCLFGNRCTVNISPSWFNNSFFYNNVFLSDGTYNATFISCNSSRTVTVDHNLFLTGSNSTPLIGGGSYMQIGSSYSNNCALSCNINYIHVLTNNIFYNCAMTYYYYYSSYYTSTFDFYPQILYNNISFSGGTLYLMEPGGTGWGTIGSGNINNTNPMMDSLFSSSSVLFNFAVDNLNLKSGSPCINAGSDGTNIGPTGGLYPIYNTNANYLTGEPPVPEVTHITVSGSTIVPEGGTLNVTVTAKKIN